jgi:hypothetical protein
MKAVTANMNQGLFAVSVRFILRRNPHASHGRRTTGHREVQSRELVKRVKILLYIPVDASSETVLTFLLNANGVGLIPLHCGHFWPIVPAPDDR